MALFPFYNRGFRGFFDDDDFGGSSLDGELFDPPFYHQRFYIQPRHHQPSSQRSTGVCPARQQQGTSVACTPDKFAINVDTRHFAPEEISVKTENNCVVIHGKHEEKSDDRGCYVKREFTRRYVLPEDVDPESVKCHLKPNGHLALEAPRKNAPKKEEAKPIPIEVQHLSASGDAQKNK
ncbi:alpha-crystallin A chain-like [Haemaphysalis longicornis]